MKKKKLIFKIKLNFNIKIKFKIYNNDKKFGYFFGSS